MKSKTKHLDDGHNPVYCCHLHHKKPRKFLTTQLKWNLCWTKKKYLCFRHPRHQNAAVQNQKKPKMDSKTMNILYILTSVLPMLLLRHNPTTSTMQREMQSINHALSHNKVHFRFQIQRYPFFPSSTSYERVLPFS